MATWLPQGFSPAIQPSKDAEVAAPDCPGAVHDRKIGHAAAKLAQLGQGNVAVSLDHAKCFDQLHPRLALDKLRMRGWPEGVLSLPRHVWSAPRPDRISG